MRTYSIGAKRPASTIRVFGLSALLGEIQISKKGGPERRLCACARGGAQALGSGRGGVTRGDARRRGAPLRPPARLRRRRPGCPPDSQRSGGPARRAAARLVSLGRRRLRRRPRLEAGRRAWEPGRAPPPAPRARPRSRPLPPRPRLPPAAGFGPPL